MDVSNSQLIEIGLNMIGYTVAAALGALIYSTFGHKKSARVQAPAQAAGRATGENSPGPTAPETRDSGEFLDLRSSRMTAPAPGRENQAIPRAGSYRRNRQEVIRLAREMMADGSPRELVKNRLPISDGELSLLNNGIS